MPAVERPNVIVIVVDDLGWHDLGVYGNRFHETPNLDRLAAGAVRFTSGYAAAPICSPSRAALQTGQSPASLHITEHFRGTPPVEAWEQLVPPHQNDHLPLETTTIAELARAQGYRTAHIGKWHLGGQGSLPQDHGYDLNIAGSGRGLPPSFFYPYTGQTTGPDLFGQPIDPARRGEYLTDRLTDEAIAFLESTADRPFLLHLAYYAVHVPIEGKPDKVARYQAKAAAGDYGFENPDYAAMVESVDENVGRVMAALDRLDLTRRTVVVFVSDNGGLSVREVEDFAAHTPATDNGPLRAGKGYVYEGGNRVPFMVWGPGVRPGVSDDALTNMDILPTIADWIGAPTPAAVEGVSLLPLVSRGAPLARALMTWHFPHYSPQGTRPAQAIREGALKLVVHMETGRTELFDLATDPGETTDLSTSRPADVARMRVDLDAAVAREDAQQPTRNASYDSQAPIPERWGTPNS